MADGRIALNRQRAAQLWHQEAALLRSLAQEARGAEESRALWALAREAVETAERFETPPAPHRQGRLALTGGSELPGSFWKFAAAWQCIALTELSNDHPF